jgi:hypothetical protein
MVAVFPVEIVFDKILVSTVTAELLLLSLYVNSFCEERNLSHWLIGYPALISLPLQME